jgi:hypothetical protein
MLVGLDDTNYLVESYKDLIRRVSLLSFISLKSSAIFPHLLFIMLVYSES